MALVILWFRRPHSVLDIWLMVVMCAWVFDIGLAAVFNAGRFDLGFYAGRLYGLLAASFVLIVLLGLWAVFPTETCSIEVLARLPLICRR